MLARSVRLVSRYNIIPSSCSSLIAMPPRRSTGSVAKRERSSPSSSSSLSDAPPEKSRSKASATNGKGKAPAATKLKVKAKVEANDGVDDEKPAKKPRVAKAKAWLPVELAPELHPPRLGHPPFQHPPLTSSGHGGLPPSTSEPRPVLLGAHVSIAGGPAGALLRAGLAGANGLAMFTKSQRQWKSAPYEQEAIDRFRQLSKSKDEQGLGYSAESILVHGSYLINLGNPDPVKWDTSYDCFKDEIHRCHQLGVKLYNWHPGSTVGACTKEESFKLIAKGINKVHEEVPKVICVIENMANAGSNIIGTAFSDLSAIIALVTDKSRVRICLDTCHLFAAGYDIRTPEAYKETMRKFDEEVGNGYLAGIHLNDSKADLGGNKDLHENIGLGKIGLTAFRTLMRDPLMHGIPIVLETPAPDKPLEVSNLSIWTREIALLYEIQKIDDEEWELRKAEIEQRWRAERDTLNPPKDKGPKAKTKGKGKKSKDSDDDDE